MPHLVPLVLLLALPRGSVGRPNIVLIVADQHRWDWTPVHMPALRMPTFSSIVTRGVRFQNAICPSPLCAPARASMATGLSYGATGVNDLKHHIAEDVQTVHKALQAAGVHTISVGKDDLAQDMKVGPTGDNYVEHLGFDSFSRCNGKQSYTTDPYMNMLLQTDANGGLLADYMSASTQLCAEMKPYVCPQPNSRPQDKYIDDWVAQEALRLLGEAPDDREFFLQVNYPGPHPPFDITKAMNESIEAWNHDYSLAVSSSLDPAKQRLLRKEYAAEIENIDQLNGKLLSYLDARGVLSNTIVCYTSDHGEMLGDFRDRAKSSAPFAGFGKEQPWQGAVSVPLACMGPGIVQQLVVEEPVSTMDLTATFLEVMGLSIEGLHARSLLPALTGGARPGHHVTSALDKPERNVRFGIVVAPLGEHVFKLVCCHGLCPHDEYQKNDESLAFMHVVGFYNISSDPYELRNLASRHSGLVRQLLPSLPFPVQGGCSDSINLLEHEDATLPPASHEVATVRRAEDMSASALRGSPTRRSGEPRSPVLASARMRMAVARRGLQARRSKGAPVARG